jgi:hypothetical protein
MATFTKLALSGSTSGRGIVVDDDATAGKLIHTAHATALDEVWLYATNYDTTDRKLTIEWGGATAGGDIIEYTVKAESGLYLIVPGLIITGSLVVRAFAATTTSINIFGYVNRIA